METTLYNTISIRDPDGAILDWCADNLIIPNPDYPKKLRMGLWVGSTPRNLVLFENRGDTVVLPRACLFQLPTESLHRNPTKSKFQPKHPVYYGNTDMSLYDYQEDAVTVCTQQHFGILQAPAGSGKTQMGIAIVQRLGLKALWLTHTLDLLKQSRDRALRYFDESLIGTISEGKVDIGKGITFATVQTMSKLDLNQYRDIWDVIVVDECHRTCGTPTAVTQFYKVVNSLATRYIYGLSATVHRADGLIKATFAILGNVICTVPESAVADKIMKVGVKPVGTGIKPSRECLNTDGTLNYARTINYLCGSPERNAIIRRAIDDERDHSCLILSDRLEHLETLMNSISPDLRPYAVMVSGKMTSKTGKAAREKAIEDMRTGRKRFLFATYSLAKEGLDIPRLDRLFLATPQKDYAIITQSIGRIARTFEGKQKPIAYDFVDDSRFWAKAYRQRCATYRKNGCWFVEDKDD